MKKLLIFFLPLTFAVSISSPAHSALQGRDLDGNASSIEAVYDDVRKITWLADANYAMTSGKSKDGRMNWDTAVAWANNLDVFGHRNWRLPKAAPACGDNALNCTTSELGFLYYLNLGGKAAGNLPDTHNANYNLFKNLKKRTGSIGRYFTGDSVPNTPNVWAFEMQTGYQVIIGSGSNYAWPVHDGDIGKPVSR